MSFHIYPVTPGCERCDEYTVTVNGEPASLNACRVSKEPFNRRWPGHQRQIEQSETAAFLLMEADEPLTFTIQTKQPFEKVVIRPLSLGIEPKVEGNTITFCLPKPAYLTVEPFGRQRPLSLFVEPPKRFDAAGADVIYFGRGEHEVGTITLKSNQTLFLEEDAVVYGCIKAIDAENIKIVGHGILDNSRNKEEILFAANAKRNDTAVSNAKRQHTIQLEYCTNILIDGITIRDSLVYNIRPIGCKNLTIQDVKILGCWRFNSDGIDMHSCENVHISHCFIRTFDDSICVKGFDCYYAGNVEKAVHDAMYRNGRSYDRFLNVVVERCVIWNDWGKSLEIGAETRAEEIANVVFRDCDIIHVTGNVLDCMNVDYADVHDIRFENIRVEYDDVIPKPIIQTNDAHRYADEPADPDFAPCLICSEVVFHHEYSAGGGRRGKNHDITFQNIRLFGRQKIAIHMAGFDEAHPSADITIDGLYQNGKKITSFEECELTCNPFCKGIRLK